ncbi:MAG TPA: AAA family ATPase [Candidatus Bathyarchaeia archaeon]|nr:AAA family ATPase [Candidatus Bathyarchaeia archaeon]
MAYYSVLGFNKEPFSTSPDPSFFYLTKEHDMALTNILIELHLRRGLSVIFGDIGTGKTSLSRLLVQELSKRGNMLFHIILNPVFQDEKQFLRSLVLNFNAEPEGAVDSDAADILELRDSFEKFLIRKAIQERQTVVLIIDEAQKLDMAALETLRVLLNFETNEYKLIQLVLLGQVELYPKIVNMPNFMDRISFKYTLNPLDAKETKELIHFRITAAGYNSRMELFLDEAVSEIYNYTRGYPRKITKLCHQVLKELILQNKQAADRVLVRDVIEKDMQFQMGNMMNVQRPVDPSLNQQKLPGSHGPMFQHPSEGDNVRKNDFYY